MPLFYNNYLIALLEINSLTDNDNDIRCILVNILNIKLKFLRDIYRWMTIKNNDIQR